MNQLPLVLAMTGASGAPYSVRLLQMLVAAERQVHLVISPSGAAVIRQELGFDALRGEGGCNLDKLLSWTPPESWTKMVEHGGHTGKSARATLVEHRDRVTFYHYENYFTPIASGSYLTEAMIVCPCSGSTLSGIVRSASSNLIERAAEVHLKERRPVIVVPRETPLSSFQLENMLRASQAGIVVLPAAPGWYHGVGCLMDLVDFVVARILDQLRIPHHLMQRWGEGF